MVFHVLQASCLKFCADPAVPVGIVFHADEASNPFCEPDRASPRPPFDPPIYGLQPTLHDFHHRASKPGRTRTPALINHQAQSVVDVTWCPVPKLAQWGLASNRIIHKSSRGPHFVTASCPRQIGPYRCRRYRTRKGPSADASGTFPGFL